MDDTNIPTIKERNLAGEKLKERTKDIEKIQLYGKRFLEQNKEFIKENIQDNWFAVIDPTEGKVIASPSQLKLYDYTTKNYPDKIFFFIGIIKNSFVYLYLDSYAK